MTALSPLDGRYATKTKPLREHFSEFGLIRARVKVEVAWLAHLSMQPDIEEVPKFEKEDLSFLFSIGDDFSEKDAEAVKEIESTTNHDVKAVEYFIKDKISSRPALHQVSEFVHFGCTSEDINNLSYGLMLKDARDQVVLPAMDELLNDLKSLALEHAGQAMLSRTHGQAASPTTMGKEIANVYRRLSRARNQIEEVEIFGKINGAVGNFNAHLSAYPDLCSQQCRRTAWSFQK